MPKKQFKILVGWLALREEEVYRAWNKAVKSEHFDKIKPISLLRKMLLMKGRLKCTN